MQIGIIGSGVVGRALASGFAGAGHSVVVGTRDPVATKDREDWAYSTLPLAPYDALEAEVYVLATSGDGAAAALAAVGEQLDGKVVIDVTNPLDFSQGFPPSLSVVNTDSLAEQLQRTHPAARLVKMFNTMANEVMVAPASLSGETTVFLAGNDPTAREVAAGLAHDLGWSDIVDLGDLSGARGMEMFIVLWLRLYSTLGEPNFNLKLVRRSA